jgi:hypothetical protein
MTTAASRRHECQWASAVRIPAAWPGNLRVNGMSRPQLLFAL